MSWVILCDLLEKRRDFGIANPVSGLRN